MIAQFYPFMESGTENDLISGAAFLHSLNLQV